MKFALKQTDRMADAVKIKHGINIKSYRSKTGYE